ncbi:hypothetical protein AAFN75_03725 [Algibacter sp. AS12]|uniref:hypothetical protein n=1 Tax=Algibacter sp. AS12 TaxID=3135773 RepID=UPI00398A9036
MTDLNEIVSAFSSEDQQKFITYLDKKNKRNDTKNIKLFNLLCKNELDSNAICTKLYGNKKNAYHALRKRLYESLIDFTANQSLQEENSADMQIIKFILASKAFLQQKQYKVAYKILDKAEKLASTNDLFPFLNEIYHTKIQYAYAYPFADIDALTVKFKTNQKNIHLEDELNIVYAKIRQTLNSIAYKGDILDFQTILTNILKEHNITLNDSMSFKSLYQLVTISSISAFITKDYLKIEPFLIDMYQIITKHKNKQKQLFYHIHILYAIANALFRNKKFKESLQYLELMHQHMQLQKKKYHKTFVLKYHLLKGLNLNYSNKQGSAIQLLETIRPAKHKDIETLLDINLSLILFYFQKLDFKKTHSLLSKLYHTDTWYAEKAGKEWLIKKNLIEILLHIELQNINLVESKLLSFKRQYIPYLKSINQQRVIIYLSFVEMYYKSPENACTPAFKSKIKANFNWQKIHKEDIFVISFYSWLISKATNTTVFKTTLNLINKAQSELTIT